MNFKIESDVFLFPRSSIVEKEAYLTILSPIFKVPVKEMSTINKWICAAHNVHRIAGHRFDTVCVAAQQG